MQTSAQRPYILFGEDSFSLRERLKELTDSITPRELLDTNTSRLDATQLTIQELQARCNTIPFLAPFRLVIVNGLLSRFDSRDTARRRPRTAPTKSKPDVSEWTGLRDCLANIPPTTILIFVDGPLSKDNPLCKDISPFTQLQEFRLPAGETLRRWVRERATRNGATLAPDALRLLIDLVGPDLWTLNNELAKLALYCTKRPVQAKDVRLLTTFAREVSIFNAIDAVLARSSPIAMKSARRLLDEEENPSQIITMLARQVRLILEAKELLAQNIPSMEIGERLGVTSEFALRKIIEQSRVCSLSRLLQIHQHLLTADLSIKRGMLDEALAIETLIVELCQPISA